MRVAYRNDLMLAELVASWLRSHGPSLLLHCLQSACPIGRRCRAGQTRSLNQIPWCLVRLNSALCSLRASMSTPIGEIVPFSWYDCSWKYVINSGGGDSVVPWQIPLSIPLDIAIQHRADHELHF